MTEAEDWCCGGRPVEGVVEKSSSSSRALAAAAVAASWEAERCGRSGGIGTRIRMIALSLLYADNVLTILYL